MRRESAFRAATAKNPHGKKGKQIGKITAQFGAAQL